MSTAQFQADLLAGKPSLNDVVRYPLRSLDFARILADRAQHPTDRHTLVAALQRQYESIPNSDAARQNIALLAQPNTYTITTGQQPGLFGGPMYVWYKTLSAIRLCQQLQAQHPTYNFVPVFWMASEDHDAAEVNHTWLSYDTCVRYHGQFGGAVGRHIIQPSIEKIMPSSHLLQDCYAPGRSWAQAFRLLLHSLFGQQGLVVLDADDRQLKELFTPVLHAELINGESFALVREQTEKLMQLGYPAQITPREINLFYLDDHQRNRIIREGNQWLVHDTARSFAESELMQLLSDTPEHLSPNVVLRPVYQEKILPNLAYIGGWAEVLYWAQLRTVFDHHQVSYPAVLPRMQALLLRHSEALQLGELALDVKQLLQPTHQLLPLLVLRHWQGNDIAQLAQEISERYAAMQALVAALDAGQGRNVAGQLQRQQQFYERLRHKLIRRLADENPAWVQPVLALKNAVQPDGMVQERVLNWTAMAAEQPAALADYLMAQCQPLAFGLHTHQLPPTFG